VSLRPTSALALVLAPWLVACAQSVTTAYDGGPTRADAGLERDVGAEDARALGADGPDAGELDAAPNADAEARDAEVAPDVLPAPDAAPYVPNEPCRELTLPCLDPSDPDVIEVPGETTLSAALMMARANQTIQIRGAALGAGVRVPAFVTLRGCQGARIPSNLGFAGSGGTVEGFEVAGEIVGNQSGTFVVRYNRFIGTPSTRDAGVSARSIDALVSASVTMIVDSNRFEGRSIGVEARTAYDTMVHEVDLTVQNNVFVGVNTPVSVSEGGLVGRIDARVEHNTFYRFEHALELNSVTSVTHTRGNLFAAGLRAVSSNSPFDVAYSFVHDVETPHTGPLVSGTFAQGDPDFVAAADGDLRLGPASAVIDRIPEREPVPSLDYYGCPRPQALRGTDALADIGALEAQP
jgi:hypothetical protein